MGRLVESLAAVQVSTAKTARGMGSRRQPTLPDEKRQSAAHRPGESGSHADVGRGGGRVPRPVPSGYADLRGQVPRYKHIHVTALDRDGHQLDFIAKGCHTQLIQHE